MCGACGTARGVAAPEELLAGAGPARRAARAAAADRLLAGRQLRISSWRGGYLVTAATGAARPVASLDQLWAVVGDPLPRPGSSSAGARWAWAPPPARWDPQAAAVWTSAALRVGTVTEAVLPAGPPDGRAVHLLPGRAPAVLGPPLGPERIGVLAPDPAAVLDALLAFACGGPAGAAPRSRPASWFTAGGPGR